MNRRINHLKSMRFLVKKIGAKQLGFISFGFFLVKGLLWLGLGFVAYGIA